MGEIEQKVAASWLDEDNMYSGEFACCKWFDDTARVVEIVANIAVIAVM